MKYALTEGIILRHEWFGCLAFQSYNGRYWQFNEDAFDILRRLKIPATIGELRENLIAGGMMMDDQGLRSFIGFYEEQRLISRRDEALDNLIFYESKNKFRKDCLVAPSSVTIYVTDYCPKHCRHCATNAHNRVNRQKELIFDDWVGIMRRLREAGVLMLVFSGGEPLSLPRMPRLLKIADEMQFGITLLYTSPHSLDSKLAIKCD